MAGRGSVHSLSSLQKTALLLGVPAAATVLYILYRRYRESRGGCGALHRGLSSERRPRERGEEGRAAGEAFPAGNSRGTPRGHLGTLWGHRGDTLGTLWGHPGDTLGTLW